MARVLRELREKQGKPGLVRRRFARWLAALGVIGSALLAGSCLIANEFAFPTVDTLPGLVAISPPDFPRVGNFPDQDCVDIRDAMAFSASVYEPVPGQRVLVHVFVNGSQATATDTVDFPPGAEQRTTHAVCLLHSLLNLPCNRVQLIAGYDTDDVGPPPVDGVLDPPYSKVEWTVLGKAKDNADAAPSDCTKLYQPDAGTTVPLPDGAVPPPPADGGTLLPVDSGPLVPVGSVVPPRDGGP